MVGNQTGGKGTPCMENSGRGDGSSPACPQPSVFLGNEAGAVPSVSTGRRHGPVRWGTLPMDAHGGWQRQQKAQQREAGARRLSQCRERYLEAVREEGGKRDPPACTIPRKLQQGNMWGSSAEEKQHGVGPQAARGPPVCSQTHPQVPPPCPGHANHPSPAAQPPMDTGSL